MTKSKSKACSPGLSVTTTPPTAPVELVVMECNRHVSASQHQIPRIPVLSPKRTRNSCSSLSPDLTDSSFTPVSLNDGRSGRQKRTNEIDVPLVSAESYEMQFYRIWKSISNEIDEPDISDAGKQYCSVESGSITPQQ